MEDRNEASTASSAHRGPKACVTCAKAKARCIPAQNSSGICERCLRLGRSCASQTPAPPRKRKGTHRPTRVAELERRIHDLTNKIEARNSGADGNALPVASQAKTYPLTPDDDDESNGKDTASGTVDDTTTIVPFDIPSGTHVGASVVARFSDHVRNHTHKNVIAGGETCAPALVRSVSSEYNDNRTSVMPAFTNARNSSWSQSATADWDTCWQPMPAILKSAHPLKIASIPRVHSPEGGRYQAEQRSQELDPSPEVDWPRPQDCDSMLDEYRTNLQPLFPFVVIPPSITSLQLAAKKPLLWKAVVLQGLNTDCDRQIPLGNRLLEEIVVASFLKPQKSLDMLQSLEVYMAWLHFNLSSYQLTNSLFLIRSFCVALGLHGSVESLKQSPTPASLEKMRSLAGVFYLVNMLFTTNKKPDAFVNTLYLDGCCKVIEQRMEHPTDSLLVAHVRIQQLTQSISTTLALRSGVANPQADVPLTILVRMLQQQIASLRASQPTLFQNNGSLRGQMLIGEIFLGEVGLNDGLCAGLRPGERLEILWACLTSVKTFLEARFSEPLGPRPRYNSMSAFDVAYAMIISLKLVTLNNVAGWDLPTVRAELDPLKYMDMLVIGLRMIVSRRRMSSVPGPCGDAEHPQKLRRVEDPYEKMVDNIVIMANGVRKDLAQLDPSNRRSNSNEAFLGHTRNDDSHQLPVTIASAMVQEGLHVLSAPPPMDNEMDVNIDWGAFDHIHPETLFAGQDLHIPDMDGSFWLDLDSMAAPDGGGDWDTGS